MSDVFRAYKYCFSTHYTRYVNYSIYLLIYLDVRAISKCYYIICIFIYAQRVHNIVLGRATFIRDLFE